MKDHFTILFECKQDEKLREDGDFFSGFASSRRVGGLGGTVRGPPGARAAKFFYNCKFKALFTNRYA